LLGLSVLVAALALCAPAQAAVLTQALPATVTDSTNWAVATALPPAGPATTFTYGLRPLVPMMGDWDANGSRTPGTFEAGHFKLSNALPPGAATIDVTFGDPRGFPVVGDFNGDSFDDVAVYRAGLWQVRVEAGGIGSGGVVTPSSFSFGTGNWPSTIPVAGDWDGNGTDGIGLYTTASGSWELRQTTAGASLPAFVYNPGIGPRPVTGDWDSDGDDTVGVRSGTAWLLNNQNDGVADGPDAAPEDITFNFGAVGDFALVGGKLGDASPTAVADSATVLEDAAATAVGVLGNDTDPDGGPKSIASVTPPANGTVVITGGGTGLTYKPNANYCNSPPGTSPDTFTYTLAPGGSTATVSMTVTCVDDPPVAVNDAATVAEDAAATVVPVLTNDTDVDGGPESIASVTQPANGTVVITGGGTGLTYKPNANYCNNPPGTSPDTFTYTLSPGGSSATVSMTVTCVNDNPVVDTSAGSLAYTENDPPKVIDTGVTVIDGDVGAMITGATVAITTNFVAGQDVLALSGIHPGISAGPQIGNTLTLSGTATPTAYQAALRDVTYVNTSEGPSTSARTVTFTVTDDTALSGSDTRGITITAVNDPPTAVDDTGSTDEDTPLLVAAPGVLANDTDVDPGDTKTVVRLNGSVALTQTLPSGALVTINASGSYSYNPQGAFQGLSTGQQASDSFTYTMQDGAAAQSTATVNITINGVSDAPTAVADSFDAIGNTGLFVGTTRPANQAGKEITGSVLTNDTDPDTPQASLVAEPVTNAPTTLGGTITIEADGNFTYQPDDADTGVTDTFTYRVCDASPCDSSTVANATGTLSLPIAGQVWYVRNNQAAGGDGTSDTPFDTLAEAEAASGTGDTVYVFDGNNTTTNLDTGYAMNAGERLIGESRPLSLDPDGGGALPTSGLFPGTSGAQPTLTASNEDVIVLASNVLVDGIDVDPAGTGGGISGASGTSDVTVQNANVTDTGTAGTQPGIEMDGTTGVNRFTGVTVTNGGSSTAIGVRLNSAGSVLFSSTATNTISTTGAKALDAATTNLLTSRWNDITVTGSGTGAIRLSNTTGTVLLGDDAGTDLSLQTTSGATAALDIASSNSVGVGTAGTDTISATGGPAVDIRNSNGSSFFFDSVSSTGSTTDGINFDTNLGTTFLGSAGAISGAGGIGVDINGGGAAGPANFIFNGSINDGPGPLSVEVTGRDGGQISLGDITDSSDPRGGIVISGNSAGSTTFASSTKVLNTGAFDAVVLSNNGSTTTGHTVSFINGGLDIDTTSGLGFSSTVGGRVEVTHFANTITTGTGTALTVDSSGITTNGLHFDSIASNGAANGIRLNNTGPDGGLSVIGIGGTCTSAASCTGGAIQNSTGAGISLTSVPGGVSLTHVAVTSGLDDGIRATTVNDVDLVDSIVTNNGNSHAGGLEERGLDYLNVTGTPQILRTTVSGSDDSNAHIRNTVAGTTTLNVDASTFSGSKFNAGLRLRGEGNSVTNATVVNSFFRQNADPGFSMQTDSANTAQQTLLFSTNEVSGGSSNAVSGRPQVSINADGGSIVKATVTNNKIKSAAGAEVILNTPANHTGTFDAKFNNNSIGDAQPGALDAPADGGSAIWGRAQGDGITRMEIRNNAVQNWGGRALELSHNDGTGQAAYTVTGNVFSNPDTPPNPSSSPLTPMYIFSGVGNVAGDTSDVCVDMENNDFDGIGQTGTGDLGINRATSNFLSFADFNATAINPPGSPNLRDNLRAKNPLSPALSLEQVGPNGVTNTLVTACGLPVGTP
jgi:VCBS repeat-containing protein